MMSQKHVVKVVTWIVMLAAAFKGLGCCLLALFLAYLVPMHGSSTSVALHADLNGQWLCQPTSTGHAVRTVFE